MPTSHDPGVVTRLLQAIAVAHDKYYCNGETYKHWDQDFQWERAVNALADYLGGAYIIGAIDQIIFTRDEVSDWIRKWGFEKLLFLPTIHEQRTLGLLRVDCPT
jgi:hypothetical protein